MFKNYSEKLSFVAKINCGLEISPEKVYHRSCDWKPLVYRQFYSGDIIRNFFDSLALNWTCNAIH